MRKTKYIRWMVLLLAACLTVGALAACQMNAGSGAGDTETDTATDEHRESQTESETATESESQTESETVNETETETENESGNGTETETETTYRDLPRFDYMGDEVLSRVEIRPEAYTSMNLKLPADLEITDQVVEDYIFNLRLGKRVAMSNEQVKDQPLRLGDDAYIYYKGVLDGEAFEGGSNMDDKEPFKLTLGSGQFIPGFEEGLVEVIPDETSRQQPYALHISFPEDYHAENLAGKAVIFYVVVEYAVQYEVPVFDRDFVLTAMDYDAKKDEAAYADEAELLNEYRAYIRATLEKEIESTVDEAKASAMWEYLLSVAVCRDLPEEEINYYYGMYVENIQSNYDYYGGMYGESWTNLYPTVDSYAVTMMGLEKGADWKAELRRQAEEPVKRDMIMFAVAEREGMKTVTEEEFESEIQYYIDYYKNYHITKTREEILSEVGEAYIRLVAFQIKMDTWLKEHCQFTYGA